MQNAKAMDIQCNICKSTFLKTTRAPQYVLTFFAGMQTFPVHGLNFFSLFFLLLKIHVGLLQMNMDS